MVQSCFRLMARASTFFPTQIMTCAETTSAGFGENLICRYVTAHTLGGAVCFESCNELFYSREITVLKSVVVTFATQVFVVKQRPARLVR